MPPDAPTNPRSRVSHVTDVLFDIRMVIGSLFAVYGAVCLVWGLVSFTDDDAAKTGGINLNLWAGLGMLLGAAAFVAWTLLRPIHPDQQPDQKGDPPQDGQEADR